MSKGAISCSECASGKYSDNGLTCLDCATGKYDLGVSCVDCPEGFVSLLGATNCSTCSPGRASQGSISECRECPSGWSQSSSGRIECSQCLPGKYAGNKGATSCIKCQPGKQTDTARLNCQDCTAGKYDVGTALCLECPAGYVSSLASTECKPCAAGRASEGSSTECTICPVGTSQFDEGRATCSQCPEGSVAPVGSKECYKCLPGTASQESPVKCLDCPVGKSQPESGRPQCTSCDDQSYSSFNRIECSSCPKTGATCNGFVLQVHSGYWFDEAHRKSLNRSVQLYECINTAACTASSSNETGHWSVKCAEGYGGRLCGECGRNNTKRGDLAYVRSGDACIKCYPDYLNTMFVVAMGLFLFVGLIILIRFKEFERDQKRIIVFRQLLTHAQMLGALGMYKARGPAVFRSMVGWIKTAGGGVVGFFPLLCATKMSFYSQFTMQMLLPVVLLPMIALLTKIIFSCRSNFQRRKIRHLQQMTREKRLRLRQERLKKHGKESLNVLTEIDFQRMWWPRAQALMIFVYFSLYPSLVQQIFLIMNCTEPVEGVRYLTEDLSIPCGDSTHRTAVGVSFFLGVVYCAGFPLCIVWLLIRNVDLLRTSHFFSKFGFLYDGYALDRGNVIVCWEVVVLFRKAAIVVLATLVDDPYTQTMLAILLLSGVLLIHLQLRPYAEESLNNLETMSLFTLLITQSFCIMYLHIDYQLLNADVSHKAGSSAGEIILTILLALINIVVLSVLFANFMSGYIRELCGFTACYQYFKCCKPAEEKRIARRRARTIDAFDTITLSNPVIEMTGMNPMKKNPTQLIKLGAAGNDLENQEIKVSERTSEEAKIIESRRKSKTKRLTKLRSVKTMKKTKKQPQRKELVPDYAESEFHMLIEDDLNGPYMGEDMLCWFLSGDVSSETLCSCDGGEWKKAKYFFSGEDDLEEAETKVVEMLSNPMKSKELVLCTVDYEAANIDEISIIEGDKIIVYKHEDENWSRGKNQRTGEIGQFPREYVEM